MNAWIIAAIATVFSVVTRAHLRISATGLTLSLSLPVVIVAGLAVTCAVLAWLTVRQLRGFRSSPYLRTAT